jgi:hypothetical protein
MLINEVFQFDQNCDLEDLCTYVPVSICIYTND